MRLHLEDPGLALDELKRVRVQPLAKRACELRGKTWEVVSARVLRVGVRLPGGRTWRFSLCFQVRMERCSRRGSMATTSVGGAESPQRARQGESGAVVSPKGGVYGPSGAEIRSVCSSRSIAMRKSGRHDPTKYPLPPEGTSPEVETAAE